MLAEKPRLPDQERLLELVGKLRCAGRMPQWIASSKPRSLKNEKTRLKILERKDLVLKMWLPCRLDERTNIQWRWSVRIYMSWSPSCSCMMSSEALRCLEPNPCRWVDSQGKQISDIQFCESYFCDSTVALAAPIGTPSRPLALLVFRSFSVHDLEEFLCLHSRYHSQFPFKSREELFGEAVFYHVV